MSHMIYFSLPQETLPSLSAFDQTSIQTAKVHFKRQYHEYIFYYILSGSLFLREGDIDYELKENDFILLDPTRVHQGTNPSICDFIYIHFSLPHLDELPLTPEYFKHFLQYQYQQHASPDPLPSIYLPKSHTLSTPHRKVQVLSLLEKGLDIFTSHELHHRQLASCLVYEMFLLLSQDFCHEQYFGTHQLSSTARHTVPQLLDYLNHAYHRSLSSTLLEERYNCNFDYLNRQFKKITGQTIFAYLTHIRIEKSKQLLATGFYSLAEVAQQTGFRDLYYFSKVFKQQTGTSPGQFGRLS